MTKNNRKIFVLGIDGGTWDLLIPLIDEGVMPNLGKIVKNGSSGILESTLPPYTAPAWVSCITGVNPGKHGIFGFTIKKNGIVQGEFVDSTRISVPKIWNYINNAGKTAGLINVPITYPAEPVDGFMVPCFFTPLGKKDYTYPQSIYEDVLVPANYVINVRQAEKQVLSEETATEVIHDIKNMAQRRYEVMEALQGTYNPDFFMVVFTCLDKVQHKFWKFLDPSNSMAKTSLASKLRPLLLSVYEEIDAIIGKILAKLAGNTTLYIVSDHGFGAQNKTFFINKWLVQNGFLKLKKFRFISYRLVTKYFKKRNFFNRNVDIFDNPIYKFINKKRSFFIGSDPYEQGIYFIGNPSSADYLDKISLLKQQLATIKDPETGKLLFKRCYHRDELYSGEYATDAPDVILKLQDYSINIIRGYPLKNKIFSATLKPTGCHKPMGIFAAYGKDIVPDNKVYASIKDVTPTVLYNMGLPVNSEMDGEVRKEIFSKRFQESHEIIYSDDFKFMRENTVQKSNYTDSEIEDVAAKLKDLGYFE
jgi:predicted AlkP superfamily phosphohydrolase/phosphomutase